MGNEAQAVPCVKCGRWNPERCWQVACPKWDDAIAQPAPAVTPLARSLAGAQSEKRLGADPIKPAFTDKRAAWQLEKRVPTVAENEREMAELRAQILRERQAKCAS